LARFAWQEIVADPSGSTGRTNFRRKEKPCLNGGAQRSDGHAGKFGIVEVGFLDAQFLADGDDGIVTAP
jgi:hypothetical protein